MKSNIFKAVCPVCQESIKYKKNKKQEIIICPGCDNSLFMYITKTETLLYPFSLNMGFKGNDLIPESELENYDNFDVYDDDSEDD